MLPNIFHLMLEFTKLCEMHEAKMFLTNVKAQHDPTISNLNVGTTFE